MSGICAQEALTVSENGRQCRIPKGNGMNVSEQPSYFYQRFGPTGECLNPSWPRITTWESEKAFSPRQKGLHVILINPPIREWSWPNIMPIGQGYVGAVAAMDNRQEQVIIVTKALLSRNLPISSQYSNGRFS